jgi:Transposase
MRPSSGFRVLAAVERAQLPAFTALADGVRLWRAELLAYFDEPATNDHAEGVINKVKVIKRRVYGLPSVDGFRERVLLAATERDHAAPPPGSIDRNPKVTCRRPTASLERQLEARRRR